MQHAEHVLVAFQHSFMIPPSIPVMLTVDALLNQVCGNLLWIGNECMGTTTFYRQLPQPTSNYIEMRVCRDEGRSNEDFLLPLKKIYVVQ